MHPLTCAGLSFVATASLLIWDVLDEPDCPVGHECAAQTIGPPQEYSPAVPLTAPDDPLCDDPRIPAMHMMPQAQAWMYEPGATCP